MAGPIHTGTRAAGEAEGSPGGWKEAPTRRGLALGARAPTWQGRGVSPGHQHRPFLPLTSGSASQNVTLSLQSPHSLLEPSFFV